MLNGINGTLRKCRAMPTHLLAFGEELHAAVARDVAVAETRRVPAAEREGLARHLGEWMEGGRVEEGTAMGLMMPWEGGVVMRWECEMQGYKARVRQKKE